MILSTHRTAETDPHPRASIWSIALIIIISALLAVFVEPLFPNSALTAHGGDHAVASPAAGDSSKPNGVHDARP
jgi:hypothetical protein